MPARIHPSSIVDPQAELADSVEIGPFCTITGKVKLGEEVRLIASVHLMGPAEIGAGTTLFPGAAVGFPPQDFKFKLGMPTAGVVIGRECLIREGATVHAATKPDVPTRVGDRVFMMACSHVGHDASVGNDVVLVNSALLAGHTRVDDRAILSGNTAVHQFARIGRLAFVSGGVVTPKDIPPFCVSGERGVIHGLNLVGLRRAGISREDITAIRRAFWEVLRFNLPKQEVISRLEELGRDCPPVAEMAAFVRESKRGIAHGVGDRAREEIELG